MMRLSGRRIAGVTAFLLLFWVFAAAFSVSVGSVRIGPARVLSLLAERLSPGQREATPEAAILWSVRLPRVLLGSVVGAALAIAGAAFQSLLRNSLADPYVLGVSTGASTGAILYTMLSGSLLPAAGALAYGRPAAAFAGAALTVAAVYVIGGKHETAGEGSHRLLLAGIVLASFVSSINVFLLTSTNQADLRGIFYWLIGDLSRPVDSSLVVVSVAVLAGAFVLFLQSRSLNLIATGEQDALILGVEVRRVKLATYITGSLVTGAVVSVSGPIAYIGLICPHLARMVFGGDNRILFPAVFIFGAVFTILADTIARTVIAPVELPVGVVTALCGAPMFIYLLHRRKGVR
jgi:iron complex transport system permease protein